VVGNVEHTLGKYLEFIQLAPHRREGVLNILLSNNIDHYKMFKLVTVESLTGIGLNIGVITKLRSNVIKFQAHLATRTRH
jgi:hypothetical protein